MKLIYLMNNHYFRIVIKERIFGLARILHKLPPGDNVMGEYVKRMNAAKKRPRLL